MVEILRALGRGSALGRARARVRVLEIIVLTGRAVSPARADAPRVHASATNCGRVDSGAGGVSARGTTMATLASTSARAVIGRRVRVGWGMTSGRCARRTGRRGDAMRARAVEMSGEILVSDDVLTSCAPWGNVCVTYGTHYVPIALPSILGSLVLFLPLIWALREVRARDKEIFALRERLGENDEEE